MLLLAFIAGLLLLIELLLFILEKEYFDEPRQGEGSSRLDCAGNSDIHNLPLDSE